jgi:hypothetical protein
MKSSKIAIGMAACLAYFAAAGAQAAPLGLDGAVLAAPGAVIETVQFLPGSGFPYPKAGGAIMDWCAVWANGCGWPAAHQFCQSRGFSHALSWNAFHAGHTYVVGSNRYCDGDACKGFSFVRCG